MIAWVWAITLGALWLFIVVGALGVVGYVRDRSAQVQADRAGRMAERRFAAQRKVRRR